MTPHSSSRDPDDSSTGPELEGSSVMARVISSAGTSVNNHRIQALKFWHHITHILLNLVQLLISIFEKSVVMRMIYSIRFHMEQLIQLLIARIVSVANMFTVRALSRTCENTQTNSTASDSDHSRLSWNLRALLRQRLKDTRMIIVSWVNIKVMLKIIQLLCMYNAVSQTFIQTLIGNIFYKYKNQDPTMQQNSILFSLNQELRDTIFAKLPFNDVFRLQAVCKAFDSVMTNDTFKAARKMSEGSFGPNVFYLENNMTYMTWQWMSFDLISQQWRKMPSFSSLPLPDVELFKDFFVAGGGGLICVDVGKGTIEELIVYQPLTKQKKTLPKLIHRRRPVLIHIFVEEISNTYKIIVAGSSTIGTKNLSRKTEVYDSRTRRWNESDDVPGPDFALNDYQTGVYVKNYKTLLCIGFLPEDKGRGILAYNVSKGVWVKNLLCQLPQNFLYNHTHVPTQITIAQLLEYNSEVFLFSEQESGQEVTHSIHKIQELEQFGVVDDRGNNTSKDGISWERILCESRNGTRGLLVYPEFECLAHGKDKFCIFNTVERSGASYTIHYKNGVYTSSKQNIPSFPRLKENSLTFHSLNPLGFTFDLTFKTSF